MNDEATRQEAQTTGTPVVYEIIDADTVRVPPGRYFLGDPCYPVRYEDRRAVYEDADGGWDNDDFVLVFPGGHQVLQAPTQWGDGTYFGTDGVVYAVDSGTLGLVPEALFDTETINKPGRVPLERLGRIVDLTEATLARREKGVFRLGNIVIDTREDDME